MPHFYPHLHRDLVRPVYGHGFRGDGMYLQVNDAALHGAGIIDRIKAVGSALLGSVKNVGRALFGDLTQLGKTALSNTIEGLKNTGSELLQSAKNTAGQAVASLTGQSDRSLRDVLAEGASDLVQVGKRAGARARDVGAELLKGTKQSLHHAAARATARDSGLAAALGEDRAQRLGAAAQSALSRIPTITKRGDAGHDPYEEEDDKVLGNLFGEGVRRRARQAASKLRGRGMIPLNIITAPSL